MICDKFNETKGRDQKRKEKIVEFSTKVGGWGQQWTDFPLNFFFEKKYKLKPLKLPKNHFKTNLFSSAMIVVILEAQTSNLPGRATQFLPHFRGILVFIPKFKGGFDCCCQFKGVCGPQPRI